MVAALDGKEGRLGLTARKSHMHRHLKPPSRARYHLISRYHRSVQGATPEGEESLWGPCSASDAEGTGGGIAKNTEWGLNQEGALRDGGGGGSGGGN